MMIRFLAGFFLAASLFVANDSRAVMPAVPGFVEGDLRIKQSRGVNLADEQPPKPDIDYTEFPLLILGKAGRNEVSRVTADENGHYKIALPPGDYLLEMKVRAGKLMDVQSRSFTIVSKETTRVDMQIDTPLSVSGASK